MHVLDYFDGPQVIEVGDRIGGRYIGVRVPDGLPGEFVIVGVEADPLSKFKSGDMDLLTLMQSGPEGWSYADISKEDSSTVAVAEAGVGPIPELCLPSPGYVLYDEPNAEELIQEARTRRNLVLEVTLDPPESFNTHRIHVESLAILLARIDSVVKYAYAQAYRLASAAEKRLMPAVEAARLDCVVPAGAGSFRLLFEPQTASSGLFEQNEIHRALSVLDVIFGGKDVEAIAATLATDYKGHLAGSVRNLLESLVQQETAFHYKWAEPYSHQPKRAGLSRSDARRLYDALQGVSDLSKQAVTYTGKLAKVDVKRGTWRLTTEDGNISGQSSPNAKSLRGTRNDLNRYEFFCTEEITVTGMGKEKKTILMESYEELDEAF